MKTSTFLPALLCGVIVAVSPVLHAQDTTAPAASAAPKTDAPANAGGPGGKQRVDPLERLSKELSLTDDQKAKLKPILDARRTKMAAVRNDTSLSNEQKMAKMKEIVEASTPDIKAILTPDQAKKYDEDLQKMKDRRGPKQQ